MTNPPSTEERVWAVLSHLSAIAFGMGLLLPVIGWSEQRRKSNYASFQCLQALGYQSLGYTVWLLSVLLFVVVSAILSSVVIVLASESKTTSGLASASMGIVLGFLVVGLLGVYFLLPVIAAVSCALGKDFRYPIMGNRLARYLGYDPIKEEEQIWLIEEHEDRWVAAMGHISVIIMLWGMLAPLTAWILQGGRSLFLKFQSIQTIVYQTSVTLLYFGAMFIYMFGFFIFIALTGFGGNMNLNSSVGIVGLVILIASMLIAILVVLILPLFHILGQWAGYRVLKGDDFRYPLVGKLVEKWQCSAGV
jgi:uncharacterized Tic20 family protein